MSGSRIDLAKLRTRIRLLPHETIFAILDDAFGLLPAAKLENLVDRYLGQSDLRTNEPVPRESPRRLRAAVEEFTTASRRGDYFETFTVNSKNCTEQSNGTTSWIAECNRLLNRCVALATRKRDVGHVVASFEQLFDLIDEACSCEFEIVFFADDGGVHEFGIHWQTVMAAWLECFARTTVRDGSYDQRVATIVERGWQIEGGAHQKMIRAVRNYEPPRSDG